MPQPLSRVRPNAKVELSISCLRDKPDLARLVCDIIALAARVEFEFKLLIVKILGADAKPAIAMYDALNADNTKLAALNAAAGAVLKDAQLRVFRAVIKAATTAQKPRHKIAHWIWGTCSELPNALLLADPSHLRRQDIEIDFVADMTPDLIEEWVEEGKRPEFDELYEPNKDAILVFDHAELIRAASDLLEAAEVLFHFRYYLRPSKYAAVVHSDDPMPEDFETSEGVLRRLMGIRLFQTHYEQAK